ncbi:hypothetical protein EJB05_50536 [Eragrostis curvula]|uniref:Uncharacterized protein n=1 Tax=Eragrostis curvula TaxID=38414 RepID=A0A5J9SY19_9POAL|nr:hypothetical protein EJB05_50536 [Eragrostis curvula]
MGGQWSQLDGQRAEDRDQAGTWGRTIERPGEVKGDPHHTRGEDKKHGRFRGLVTKPAVNGFPVWASKPVADGFPVWASKPAVADGGARGTIAKVVSRRSKDVKGPMSFGRRRKSRTTLPLVVDRSVC